MSNLEKLNVLISEAETVVAKLKSEAAELEKTQAKPVWEPKSGGYFISAHGTVQGGGPANTTRLFGVERGTRESADNAVIEMRKFNRLLAYRDEFAPGYKFSSLRMNYRVVFRHSLGEWGHDTNQADETAGAVYMPKDVAIELVRKLNSGEVVL